MTTYRTLDPAIIDFPLMSPDDWSATSIPEYFLSGLASDLYYTDADGVPTLVASNSVPVAHGVSVAAIPPALSRETDVTTKITVKMIFGNPQTVSDADFLAGVNQMLVGAFGRWELIYYRDVTNPHDGTLIFSHLIRGVNGTDAAVLTHTAGEAVLLDLLPAVKFVRPIAEKDTSGTTLVVPKGASRTLATGVGGRLGISGAGLRCWPPTDARASLSGSDLAFNWKRRDRLPKSSWIAAPALSDAESYTFDIYKYVTGVTTPIKTVTGLTTAAYTVLAADLAAATATGLDYYVVCITQDNLAGRGWPLLQVVHV